MRLEVNHIPGSQSVRQTLPYEIEENGGVTYRRWTDGTRPSGNRGETILTDQKEYIERTTVTTVGSVKTTKNEKTWASWSARATATYFPINAPAPADIYA